MKFSKKYILLFLLIIPVVLVSKLNAVTYLFSHGVFDTEKQAEVYMKDFELKSGDKKINKLYIIDGKTKTFNYPDANMFCRFFSYMYKTSLGQENELEALKKAYNEIKDKEDDIVLVGVSRGASILPAFVNSLDECDCKKIKAVLLISPFAHAYDIFERNFFYKFLYFLFRIFSSYKESGPHPIDCICKINKAIPVLIACSKMDKTVPSFSSIRLYKKLLESGHPQAYLLPLNTGAHAKFLSSPDAENFQNIIHAFYKKHELPCDEEFARLGAPLLNKCKFTESGLECELDNFAKNKSVGIIDGAIVGETGGIIGGIKNSFISVYSYFKSFLV